MDVERIMRLSMSKVKGRRGRGRPRVRCKDIGGGNIHDDTSQSTCAPHTGILLVKLGEVAKLKNWQRLFSLH